MMTILLDTHVLIWMASNPERISDSARDLILDVQNNLYLSTVSLWEMQIKVQLGKLIMGFSVQQCWEEQRTLNAIRILPVDPRHVWALSELPNAHRDPFDRMLIAQAICDDMCLISADEKMKNYPVNLAW